MSEKKLHVVILKSNRVDSLTEKINQHIEEGYVLVGEAKPITENIEIQRAGTFHHYRNIFIATMKLKDE